MTARPSAGPRTAAARQAKVPVAEVATAIVRRRSIDARRGRVWLQLVVELVLRDEAMPPSTTPQPVDLPALSGEPPVVIVGAGPAGTFCAWALAQRGIGAVVLERGKPVRPRRHDLAALTKHGRLDPESNYCFGEGGAGTFSDGKLYTRAHKRGDLQRVLEAFVGYAFRKADQIRPYLEARATLTVVMARAQLHHPELGGLGRVRMHATVVEVVGRAGVLVPLGEVFFVDASVGRTMVGPGAWLASLGLGIPIPTANL